jgi:hypothetical protein
MKVTSVSGANFNSVHSPGRPNGVVTGVTDLEVPAVEVAAGVSPLEVASPLAAAPLLLLLLLLLLCDNSTV